MAPHEPILFTHSLLHLHADSWITLITVDCRLSLCDIRDQWGKGSHGKVDIFPTLVCRSRARSSNSQRLCLEVCTKRFPASWRPASSQSELSKSSSSFLTHSFPKLTWGRMGQNSQEPFTHVTKEKPLSAPSQISRLGIAPPTRCERPKFSASSVRISQHSNFPAFECPFQVIWDREPRRAPANVEPGWDSLIADYGWQGGGDTATVTPWCYSHLRTMAEENTGPKGDSHESKAKRVLEIFPGMSKF